MKIVPILHVLGAALLLEGACSAAGEPETRAEQTTVSAAKRVAQALDDVPLEPTDTYNANAYRYNPLTGAWEEGDACTVEKNIYVMEPGGEGPYPVFLYTGGTWEEWASSPSAQAIVKYARDQGFVAAFVEYRNDTIPRPCNASAGGWKKARCAYSSAYNPKSAIQVICDKYKTGGCSQGIVTAGLSQGGYLAAMARNYDTRVRGAWTMGIVGRYLDGQEQECLVYGPGELGASDRRLLYNERLRVIRGEADWTGMTKLTASGYRVIDPESQACFLTKLTGSQCGYTKDCLRGENESGWYLVPGDTGDPAREEVVESLNPAGHCFMVDLPLDRAGNKVDCVDLNWNPNPLQQTLDPRFAAQTDPSDPSLSGPTHPGGLYENVKWLKETILPLGDQASADRQVDVIYDCFVP